jgi:hypothetical protein
MVPTLMNYMGFTGFAASHRIASGDRGVVVSVHVAALSHIFNSKYFPCSQTDIGLQNAIPVDSLQRDRLQQRCARQHMRR